MLQVITKCEDILGSKQHVCECVRLIWETNMETCNKRLETFCMFSLTESEPHICLTWCMWYLVYKAYVMCILYRWQSMMIKFTHSNGILTRHFSLLSFQDTWNLFISLFAESSFEQPNWYVGRYHILGPWMFLSNLYLLLWSYCVAYQPPKLNNGDPFVDFVPPT